MDTRINDSEKGFEMPIVDGQAPGVSSHALPRQRNPLSVKDVNRHAFDDAFQQSLANYSKCRAVLPVCSS
jgi:hypothetical protein